MKVKELARLLDECDPEIEVWLDVTFFTDFEKEKGTKDWRIAPVSNVEDWGGDRVYIQSLEWDN